MIQAAIKYHQYRSYTQSSNCIVTGAAFYNSQLCEGQELLELVSSWELEEHFTEGLKHLNGFYAVFRHTDHQLLAAVDRFRSIPLFYGQKGLDFYLSDSAEWIRQQIGDGQLDPLAEEEFLLTGYVTGPDTLYRNVKQLQAGEAISVTYNSNGLLISVRSYYKLIFQNFMGEPEEELLNKLDAVLVQAFKRLICIADSRTLVVPLSGGYDSRLILFMLKRLNYNNVITFTYGLPGNRQSAISQQVAQALGYSWEFVPSNNSDWYRWAQSEEYRNYYAMADGLSSLPHTQDWGAVWELKNRGVIPPGSIFIPGLTVASLKKVSGRHQQEQVIAAIIDNHYCLWPYEKRPADVRKMLEARIESSLEQLITDKNCIDPSDLLQSWNNLERQPKFITNSVRVYEYWGFQWWLPLWDAEYVDFWSRVPFEYRLGRKLYEKFIDKINVQIFNNNPAMTASAGHIPAANSKRPRPISSATDFIKRILKRTILRKPLKKILLLLKCKREYFAHPQAYYGRFPWAEYKRMYRHGAANVNSMTAFRYLQEKQR
ncbi:MAG: asparagine synthase-related protein [Syntrophomonas sp.]|nr:asparagine synthase-related protein [Syntrophomonadaceae bacterium]